MHHHHQDEFNCLSASDRSDIAAVIERLDAVEEELHRQHEEILILKEENRFLRRLTGRDDELIPMDERVLEEMR